MPKIIKINDGTAGHTGCGQSFQTVASLNTILGMQVYCEGIPVSVAGDTFSPHPNTNNRCSGHTPVVNPATASPNVFAGGIPVSIVGGLVNCNQTTTDNLILNPINTILTNVYVNGY